MKVTLAGCVSTLAGCVSTLAGWGSPWPDARAAEPDVKTYSEWPWNPTAQSNHTMCTIWKHTLERLHKRVIAPPAAELMSKASVGGHGVQQRNLFKLYVLSANSHYICYQVVMLLINYKQASQSSSSCFGCGRFFTGSPHTSKPRCHQ